MQDDIEQLVLAAGKATAAADWQESEKLWRRIADIDPNHSTALCSLGILALQRGDSSTALELLTRANAAAPADILVLLNLAVACRQTGNASGEREAIDAALSIDPRFVPGLLQKADWMERHGTPTAAVTIYKGALLYSPPEKDWPTEFRQHLTHARDYVRRHANGLFKHLHRQLDPDIAGLVPSLAARWREAVTIRAGIAEPNPSISNQLHIPRLPAIPFYERDEFPFLAGLEQKTDAIQAELARLIARHGERFEPYINYRPGEPVNQWRDLNHSLDWGAFHLWKNGQPVAENLAECPATTEIMQGLPLAGINGLCPNVFFSSLQPHTRIPPHNGESNARLIGHLPLLIPEGCHLRVGFEEREWRIGETLIFDDTLTHEAVNDSDDLRVVLIFDLWNPLLTDAERELASELAAATRAFDLGSRDIGAVT